MGSAWLLWMACAGSGEGADASAGPDLTGVWAVTHRYQDGSCPDVTGGTQAMMWTVSRDSAGAYTVKVQGQDDLAELDGRSTADGVDLVGFGARRDTTQWRLAGSSTAVSGRAIETRTSDAFSRDGGRGRDGACAIVWTVEATRQGG